MKTALVAMWLAGSALSVEVQGEKLVEKSGVIWTIRTEAGPAWAGISTSTIHHLLRNGTEVAKVEGGESHQHNPTMSSSTRWTFKIEDGALKALQERYDSRTDVSGRLRSSTTVTPFTWDGKALVAGTPTTKPEP